MLFRSWLRICWAVGIVQATAIPNERDTSLSSAVEARGENLPAKYFADLGAERINLKYGPFLVPAVKVNMGMRSFQQNNMSLPCRDCYITGFQADLWFPNGTNANANTGMILHHAILYNANRKDTSCPDIERSMERNFGAGNERGTVDLTKQGKMKTGYYVGANDTFILTTELMNDFEQPREAVISIEWEYLPATAKFAAVRPIWIDIDGSCGSFVDYSNVPVPANTSAFNLAMPSPWPASFPGEVHSIYNHLHDGGVSLEVSRNDKLVCHGAAGYGESPGYIAPMTGGHHHHADKMVRMDMPGMDMRHISSISNCTADLGRSEKGDKWSVKAHYNLTAHPPMLEPDQTPAPIMGIAVLFVIE